MGSEMCIRDSFRTACHRSIAKTPGRKVLTHLGFHGDSKLCTHTNMRTHTYHRQTTTNHTCVPARIHTNIRTRRQAHIHTNALGVLDGPHCFLSSALLNIGTRAFTHTYIHTSACLRPDMDVSGLQGESKLCTLGCVQGESKLPPSTPG